LHYIKSEILIYYQKIILRDLEKDILFFDFIKKIMKLKKVYVR